MKRLFAAIAAMMLVPTLANADNDMISVSELRKQVERMERWKQNYKDDYGRSIGVDVEPIMNKIEKVPILMMDSPVISEENVYNAFQQESVSVLENDVAIDYTCIDPETGGNVLISLVKEDNWLYPTPECGDIDLQISILDEKRDISSELVVLDGFFASPNEIDMNRSYLGEKSLTVNDGMELIERRMNELFPDYDLKFELFRFGVVNASEPYYSCAIRQKIYGIPILMCAKDPILNAGKEKLGFDPQKEWNSQRLKYGTYDKPSWVVKLSDKQFEILCRPLKIKNVIVDDVPLCGIEQVIHSIEEAIQKGYVRNVYTLRFGYCCYLDVNENIILCPIWEVECDYMFKPEQNMADYKENSEVPIPSRLYYRTMIVNAQTGEFMNPVELKEKLLDCPEIITWEDIQ